MVFASRGVCLLDGMDADLDYSLTFCGWLARARGMSVCLVACCCFSMLRMMRLAIRRSSPGERCHEHPVDSMDNDGSLPVFL